MSKAPSEIKQERKDYEREFHEKQLNCLRSKPCLICENGRIKEAIRVNLCGKQEIPFIQIPCAKCTIPGLCEERHEREEVILHDPMNGSYWIDGGGESSECVNFKVKFDA